jgi:hypothetical protein
MFGTAPGSFEPPTVDHRLVAFFAPSLLGRGGRDRAQDEPLLKCVHAWQARETEPQQDAEALTRQLTKSTVLSPQISTLDTSASPQRRDLGVGGGDRRALICAALRELA